MVEIRSRQKYQYDAANRLVQVKNDSDVTIASYTYGSSERAEPLNCRKCKLELKHRRKCKSEKKRQAVVENTARRARTVRWNHLFGVICGSEHGIAVRGSFRNGLQHVPMLNDLAFVVEAEDVHARVFLAAPVQIPHMDERQVSVNRHALDLARQATGLFEIADQWLRAIREQRVVLDVGAGNETGKQIGLPGIEYLAVKGADAFFHFCSVVHATLLCLGHLIV